MKFVGIAISTILVLIFMTVNFTFIMGYCLRIIFMSIQGPLPWVSDLQPQTPNPELSEFDLATKAFMSQIVQVEDSGLSLGHLNIGLLVAVIISMGFVAYLSNKGMIVVSKISEISCTGFVVMVIGLLLKVLFMEGSKIGYQYFFFSGIARIFSIRCLVDAATEALLLSGASQAFFVNYSAMKDCRSPLCYPIKFFLSGAMILGLVCSLVVCGYLGHLVSTNNSNMKDFDLESPHIALQVYCLIISQMGLPNLILIIFVGFLFLIGSVITVSIFP